MEFYYSKLTYFQNLGEVVSQYDLLIDVIKNIKPTIYRSNPYTVIDIEEHLIGKKRFVSGRLVKFNDREESVVDVTNQKTTQVNIQDKLIAEALFIVDFEENILMYHENKAHINKNSFIDRFNEIIYSGLSKMGSFYSIELNSIKENYAFYERLQKLDIITVLTLSIVPTNPDPTDLIAGIDQKLKKQNLKKKTTKYTAKQGGLVLDEEIRAESLYTDMGYGQGRAEGEENGRSVVIHSKRSEKQKKETLPDLENMHDIVTKIEELLKKRR